MGSRVEQNSGRVEEASNIEQQGVQEAQEDAAEVSEVKSILEGMNTDVDEDILSGIEATREAAKSEGAADMEGNVHATLEGGYDIANEAIEEGTEQAAASHEAASEFSAASGASEFGSSTAENSSQQAEDIAGQFESNVETAQSQMEEAESQYSEYLSEIES